MIQALSGSRCIKRTDESSLVMDSSVPLRHHDPDRSWITNPDPYHPRGRNPLSLREGSKSRFQGSRLTFQLASPVASDRFNSLAKANFSLARCRHLLLEREQNIPPVFASLILLELQRTAVKTSSELASSKNIPFFQNIN